MAGEDEGRGDDRADECSRGVSGIKVEIYLLVVILQLPRVERDPGEEQKVEGQETQ